MFLVVVRWWLFVCMGVRGNTKTERGDLSAGVELEACVCDGHFCNWVSGNNW